MMIDPTSPRLRRRARVVSPPTSANINVATDARTRGQAVRRRIERAAQERAQLRRLERELLADVFEYSMQEPNDAAGTVVPVAEAHARIDHAGRLEVSGKGVGAGIRTGGVARDLEVTRREYSGDVSPKASSRLPAPGAASEVAAS